MFATSPTVLVAPVRYVPARTVRNVPDRVFATSPTGFYFSDHPLISHPPLRLEDHTVPLEDVSAGQFGDLIGAGHLGQTKLGQSPQRCLAITVNTKAAVLVQHDEAVVLKLPEPLAHPAIVTDADVFGRLPIGQISAIALRWHAALKRGIKHASTHRHD